MWTSAGQGDGSPIPFYERYGFVRTGEVVFDDEVLLRLELTELDARGERAVIRVRWCTGRHPCSMRRSSHVERANLHVLLRVLNGTITSATRSRGVSEWTITGTEVGGDRIEVRGCDLGPSAMTVSSSRRTASGSSANPSGAGKRSSGSRGISLVEPASADDFACTRTFVMLAVAPPAGRRGAVAPSASLIGMRSKVVAEGDHQDVRGTFLHDATLNATPPVSLEEDARRPGDDAV